MLVRAEQLNSMLSSGSFLQHFEVLTDEDHDATPRPRLCERADIYLASRTGDIARVRNLVERDGVDINRRDFWDSVPLYYACLCGHVDVVKYLLSQGAICSENTFDGDRCLYGALTIEIRDLLLQADVKKAPPLKPLGTAIKKLCTLCDDPEQPAEAHGSFDDLCDLELTLGEVVYRLNKVILAARLTRFDEILSSLPISGDIHRISFSEGSVLPHVVEALLIYVYSEKIELDTPDVDQLRKLARHYGNPALVKMTEKELHSIKYYFKSIKRDTAPKRFILYPYSFPEEASLEHDLQTMYQRSRTLDEWMGTDVHSLSEVCVRNDYADAVLSVQQSHFRVHLCVLCSRSDFFRQLTVSSEHGFEALPQIKCPIFGQSLALLHMRDVHVQSMRLILEYLYTDSMNSLSEAQLLDTELLSELFELSDRFLVFRAKRLLGEQIKRIESTFYQTCQLLVLADDYDVQNLRDSCLERIAEKLDELLSTETPCDFRIHFEAFVTEFAPPDVTDAETLFDSSATKGDFHGVLSGTAVTGVGSNTVLEDLREKYLEIYGWEGEERDVHAKDFDRRFLHITLAAMDKRRC